MSLHVGIGYELFLSYVIIQYKSMSTVRVVFSLVSLIVVLVVVQAVAFRFNQKPEAKQEVQSLQTSPTPTSGTTEPTATPSTKIKLGISPTLPLSVIEPATSVILNNFIYANATVIEQDETHVVMQTFEPVQSVFQWYEKKLVEQNAREKATVKTELNKDFLAKMNAIVYGRVVNIEIEKKSEENITTIKIAIRPS